MRGKGIKRAVGCMVTLAVLGVARFAGAQTFIGSKGALEAEATFSQLGSNLVLTLSNISTADVLQPTQVLTAVFFTLAGDPTLTPVSAELGSGASVLFPPKGGAGTNLGDEWAYGGKLKHAPAGAEDGVSSLGLGMFSKANFPGPKMKIGFDTLGFGLDSSGDITNTGVAAVKGPNPLVEGSMVFTLAMPTNYVLGNITDVEFQYGTAVHNPELAGVQQTVGPGTNQVPEPASVSLVAGGLGLLILLQVSRHRSHSR